MDRRLLSPAGQAARRSTDSCLFPEERVAGDALFRTTLVLAASVVLLFLLLPIVAVFLQVPPRDLVSALAPMRHETRCA